MSLKSRLVSLNSDAFINRPPDPALFSGTKTLNKLGTEWPQIYFPPVEMVLLAIQPKGCHDLSLL